jgi:branched-chain amino acid transport system substrate-binding protein
VRVQAILTALAVGALGVAAGLAGCDGGSGSRGRIAGHRLTIYASLPEEGRWSADALAVRRGAELALAQAHAAVGKYRIAYVVLDDSTVRAGTSVPGLIASNAQAAAADKTTIGYLGEFNPGASAISIPVLNRAGIPQVSPTDGAAGLTTATSGAFPGEPEKYYPARRRTFARVVPSDSVEALAQVDLQRRLGCTRTYVLDDQTVYGADLANIFVGDAGAAGLSLAGIDGYDGNANSYGSLAATVAATGADCIFLSAMAESNAAAVTAAIGAALPQARIFASDGVADGAYLDPSLGGIPLALDHRVYVTMAPLAERAYPPASRAFFAQYEQRYGPVRPYALYGYAAMSLLLRAVDRATDHGRRGAERSKVLAAIFATRNRRSVLGTYSIDRAGNTTLSAYGAYRASGGRLVFLRTFQG